MNDTDPYERPSAPPSAPSAAPSSEPRPEQRPEPRPEPDAHHGTASQAQYGSATEPQYSQYQSYPYYTPQQAYDPQYANDPHYPYAAYAPYGGYPAPGGGYGPPVAPPQGQPPRRRRGGPLVGFGAGIAAAALVLGGVVLANDHARSAIAGSGSAVQQDPDGNGQQGNGQQGNGQQGNGQQGNGQQGNGSSGQGNTSGAASATQQIGVVTIDSTLKYQQAESAGTGMILTSNGRVLTNNHVINGATSVSVTVETTGRTYRADVVGTAPSSDVAVLQLRDASGLQTAKFADSSDDVKVGDAVTGVGNAGGTGSLTASTGQVTALNQSITASDESGQSSEKLHDLIEINAKIIAGDSGGPLYDKDGEVIGMDTAASARHSSRTVAYAIPIENAQSIVKKIDAGTETTSIHIGLPGFLGITTQDGGGNGARVYQLILPNGPAAQAGISEGSVITGVNGKNVTSPESLRNALLGDGPGSKVSVTWTDPSGKSHTASTTLTTGPAD